MLTITELASMAHCCCATVDIPVIVDAVAGFGEPLHVTLTIRALEQDGGSAMEVEEPRIPNNLCRRSNDPRYVDCAVVCGGANEA